MKHVVIFETDASRPTVSLDEKDMAVIRSLLDDTMPQFRQAFLELAESAQTSRKDRRRFLDLRTRLTELIVPRPVRCMPMTDEEFREFKQKLFEEEGGSHGEA